MTGEAAHAGPPPLYDHTYVRLEDGSLFCVAGNQHTPTEVLGCLYYAPTSRIGDWGIPADQAPGPPRTVAPDGSPMTKIGPVVARGPARFTAPLGARGVRWWPTTHLQAVARDRITAVFDPVAALAKALTAGHGHGCPQDVLTRLVGEATSGQVPTGRLGLTGSASLHPTNLRTARDLDLVLLPPVRLATFTTAGTGYQPLADLDTADPRRRHYLATRLSQRAMDVSETRTVVARRRDVGWVGPVQIDLTEIAAPAPIRESWWFDQPSTGLANQDGTIATVGDGYPFHLTLTGSDRPVLVSRRGWQGVLRPGDHIAARGPVFPDGGIPVLVVDDCPDHALHLRNQPANDDHQPHRRRSERDSA
ncbi:MAG: hypothetical protein HKP61_12815 [Dactylosporangium sp.]|nr:hypothetical protein [Dactylosporangium sp.]NNJ61801.1 hypothetical protein [Dactylosporangium sp.]